MSKSEIQTKWQSNNSENAAVNQQRTRAESSEGTVYFHARIIKPRFTSLAGEDLADLQNRDLDWDDETVMRGSDTDSVELDSEQVPTTQHAEPISLESGNATSSSTVGNETKLKKSMKNRKFDQETERERQEPKRGASYDEVDENSEFDEYKTGQGYESEEEAEKNDGEIKP
jgi:hypothetical protein